MTPATLTAVLLSAIVALTLVWAYAIARGLKCGICVRPFAIFAGTFMDRAGRCWRHRLRRKHRGSR